MTERIDALLAGLNGHDHGKPHEFPPKEELRLIEEFPALEDVQKRWLSGILDAMNQELEDREKERRTRSKVVTVRHAIIPLTRHLPLLGLV